MSNIQHKDNTQLYILTTGQSIDSLIPFSSPVDEYRIAFEDRAGLMLRACTITPSKGYTPFLIFRYLSLSYLDFGDSLGLNCVKKRAASSGRDRSRRQRYSRYGMGCVC